MIEDYLEKFRKQYLKISPPDYLEYYGWQNLSAKLDTKKTTNLNLLFGKGLAFAVITLLLFGGVVGAAQAAKPGDALYPVKLAADETLAKVSGKPEITVEKRGQDIVNLSQKSPEQLDEANKQYQKALDNSANQAKDLGKQEEFKKTLDNQEQKFEREIKRNPQSANRLEKAIEQTQKARGQVKGEKDENHNEQNRSSNREDNNNSQNHEGNNHSD